MKTIFTLIIALSLLPFAGNAFAFHSNITPAVAVPVKSSPQKHSYKQTKALMEHALGRKLKFSEKAALRLQSIMPDLRMVDERKANSDAVLGFVFALCGLLAIWPLLIPGLILSNSALRAERMQPGTLIGGNKDLAKAGRVISIIGFALTIILVMILLALLLTAGFGGL